jgi:hypothetical protein
LEPVGVDGPGIDDGAAVRDPGNRMAKNTNPTDRMIAVLERIETELRGVKAEARETNERLGRLEGQAKRTNRRLGNLEKRLTHIEVPALAALEERVGRLEAAVFKPAAE